MYTSKNTILVQKTVITMERHVTKNHRHTFKTFQVTKFTEH